MALTATLHWMVMHRELIGNTGPAPRDILRIDVADEQQAVVIAHGIAQFAMQLGAEKVEITVQDGRGRSLQRISLPDLG